ncbi:hypothetical protein ABBQ38_007957 [Trebouxia sp. C0009 RCD-2024]
MATEANKDAAVQSLDIAKAALVAGNLDKAQRFAEKAMKLYPSDEVRKVTIQINSRKTSAPSVSSSGPSSSSASRARPSASTNGPALPVRETDNSTPEQRELVRNIRRTKDFYEILSISKTANDDDIKKAYRKLALKLHPDKNQAKGADEAFKAVSKAFSCLSNPDNRAAYDRYGDQEGAGVSGQRRGPAAQGFGGDGFDAEEIFNMFFGNGFGGRPGAGANVFQRHNFGGPARQPPRQQGGQQQQSNPIGGLLHIIPVVILLLFTFFSSPSEPAFSLDRTSGFSDEMVTRISSVPFFVKNQHEFEQKHPIGKRDRQRVESEVERSYMERLQQVCYREKQHQQQLFRWGQKDKARNMELPSCAELNSRFGYQYSYVY